MSGMSLKRWAGIVTVMVAAATISRGIVLTFFYDIFESCLSAGPSVTGPSLACEYGPQVLLHNLSGLLIVGFGFLLLYKANRLVGKLAVPMLAIAFVILMMLSWRLLNSISENMFIMQGPETFTQYVFVLYANLEVFVVSSIIALFYTMGVNFNTLAVVREEPRQVWGSKKTVTATVASAATKPSTTKSAPKKTTVKKSTSKGSTSKKKSTAKKS